MDKHWLKSYPDGVAHEIDPEQFRSLNQLLEESFKNNASKPFAVCMDRGMSYAQLDELSCALGAWLQNLGLEPGARVAIMLPNVPHAYTHRRRRECLLQAKSHGLQAPQIY